MKPLGLYLKGFSGIASGLRKDEITLDLTIIPETARLVALSAPNGKGKSTILDNLHPYRIMPGRAKGKHTPSAFSYWDELCAPVAEKRFDWEHQGVVYRSNLLFKSTGKSQSQTAYLLQRTGQTWEPVKLADGTRSDGSASSYDRCLDEILGKCQVFVTTAFAASKRRMLSEYETSDIKKLLSVWLNVERLLKTSADAAEVSALLQARLTELQSELREEAPLRKAARESAEGRAALKIRIDAKTVAIAQAEAAAEQARTVVVQFDARVEGMREFDRQRTELRQQIETERKRGDDQENETRRQALASSAVYRQQETDLMQALVSAGQDLRHLQLQLDQVLSRINEEADIKAAIARLQVARKRHGELSVLLEENRKQVEALKPHRQMVIRQTEAKANAHTNGSAARKRKDQIEVVAALAGKVPCVNTSLQSRCELLADALAAKSQLATVAAELFRLRSEYRSADKLLEAAGVEVAKLDALEAKGDGLREELDAIAREITTLMQTAAREEVVAEARRQRPALEALITQKQQFIAATESKRAASVADARKFAAEVDQRVALGRRATADIIAGLEARLAALPAEPNAQVRADAVAARDKADQAVVTAKQALADLRAQLTEVERQLAQTQVRLEQLEPVRKVAEALTFEIACWEQAALAVGKNGLVAFEIDDAGPEISAHANDLLKECYDGQFVVRFATQHELRTGELREGFDIRVRDTQGGPEISIDDLSNGQEAFVNECVTRAVALYLAESGRYQFDTLFTDEADGRLDEDKKRQFVAMKRRVLEIGRYSREYFVTQTKELQGMADYVIDVSAL
ncbi:hypothetical protein [Paraburkholderia sp. SIMBA_054]|uniref:hypothetical protein n=1 Tax=Paraburkholderia sp. SIMBA_054 TaxID=3085795 RepID=UPI00397A118F